MKHLLIAATALCAAASTASAAIIPVLDTITPSGGDYTFSYSGTLAGDQGLVRDSQLVIFDFYGYVAGSITAGIYAADVATSIEFTSTLTPQPGVDDDPLIENLVFTWVGSPFNATGGPFSDVSFSGLAARSIYGGSRLDGFSAKATVNNGAATGELAFNTGLVGVPAPIPEPATWALLISGFGLAGAMLRQRRQSAFA